MSGSVEIRASELKLEKHRLEQEVYSVDFASGDSPRLSTGEVLTTGTVYVVRRRGSTQTNVTSQFATGSSIAATVATGAQASSALQFTLNAASATGDQDADEDYYLRVEGSATGRTPIVSIHKLVVIELGDWSAP